MAKSAYRRIYGQWKVKWKLQPLESAGHIDAFMSRSLIPLNSPYNTRLYLWSLDYSSYVGGEGLTRVRSAQGAECRA